MPVNRLTELRRRGTLALSPDEKRELHALDTLRRHGRQKPVTTDGIRLIMNRFENHCAGCGRKLIRGIEVRLDLHTNQIYCLNCKPAKSPIQTIRLSPEDIDKYLSC